MTSVCVCVRTKQRNVPARRQHRPLATLNCGLQHVLPGEPSVCMLCCSTLWSARTMSAAKHFKVLWRSAGVRLSACVCVCVCFVNRCGASGEGLKGIEAAKRLRLADFAPGARRPAQHRNIQPMLANGTAQPVQHAAN